MKTLELIKSILKGRNSAHGTRKQNLFFWSLVQREKIKCYQYRNVSILVDGILYVVKENGQGCLHIYKKG